MALSDALGAAADPAPTDDAAAGAAPSAEPAESAQPAASGDSAGSAEPKWFLAEGVPGEGDPPEWFKSSKYKTLAEQARAYQGLESKLGKAPEVLGAPEETEETKGTAGYDVAAFVPEGMDLEVDPEDPFFQALLPKMRELDLSQGAVSQLAQAFIAAQADLEQQSVATMTTEVGELGGPQQVQQRLDGIRQYAKANLSAEMLQGLERMIDSGFNAQGFEAIEQLIGLHRGTGPAGPGVEASTPVTKDELRQMQLATDENGRRKMQTDPEYAKRVRALYAQVYGTEPSVEIVGRR